VTSFRFALSTDVHGSELRNFNDRVIAAQAYPANIPAAASLPGEYSHKFQPLQDDAANAVKEIRSLSQTLE